MIIREYFEKLDLHDASIEKVERLGDDVILSIRGVLVLKDHPMSQGDNLFIEDCKLKIVGVSSEVAKFWENDVAPISHPEPDYPLDEIMNASFENGVFHFDGFKNTTPWYEWFLHANGFELDVYNYKKGGT
ncbi:hypothetical protein [Shewanella colwelliana]|uniref:hypothetical protein n=1 Tax=Shewanella colwelliana TaxID=23 RepID=UPI00048C5AB8|nr:hypothetical protein [Shewanella colwelliana]